ncbi:ABC transporter ATP-binding protein/permease [Methanospirillum sp. J.3.6.1-F.2.7.3]|uniref:ABC transporter ATP-binding protein/permease n=1 Tax=Methanospirillum purgamenti TaxID=2834276 RepID=A0A8E7EJA0_9EURY|nr:MULTISPECIES: ABC transporter ATP-binding protein [Methanospirillum]MDX8550492.1 ABC transporter ATP-binding protein [Methanospirillum hungatei]QVV88230.1 ABC transporter ATP-binding protein/permease [Methanospirillum sp. J.3.6.1-F.2.7.3]
MAHEESPEYTSGHDGSFFHRLISLCIDLRLVRLIPGLGRHVTRTFFAALLSSLASILLLFFVSTFISGLIDGNDLMVMLPALTGMIGMLTIRIAAEVFRERSAHTTAGVMKRAIRSRMYEHLLRLGPGYTDRNDSGSIAATFVDGTEQLEQYVAYYIPYILLCMIVPATLFVGFSVFVDPITALILLIFVPLVPVMIMISNRKRRIGRGDVWREYKNLSAYYSESLQGLPTLKLFNQHKARAGEIRIRADRLSHTWIRRLRIGLLVSFAAEMVPYLGYGLALLYVCIQMSVGVMSTRQVMLVLLLGPVFYEHVIHLGQYYHNSINAKTTINAILELIRMEPSITDVSKSKPLSLPLKQTIRFSDVSFSYEQDRPVLKNCSFFVNEGEMIALVGASGVGKSTVVDLLFRYYDTDDGKIEVCGHSIRDIPLDLLRQNLSLVSQDTYLFYDTIQNNLLFGRPDATNEEIQKALQVSRLDAFIQSLPEGTDTMAGERGLRLSGGERQRIAIARAILKDAPILILDEPTASVDAESERHIREALKKLLIGRTVLVIAHRLSTIRDATRILVMEEGSIVESGTHEELMKMNGRYTSLVHAQELAGGKEYTGSSGGFL